MCHTCNPSFNVDNTPYLLSFNQYKLSLVMIYCLFVLCGRDDLYHRKCYFKNNKKQPSVQKYYDRCKCSIQEYRCAAGLNVIVFNVMNVI